MQLLHTHFPDGTECVSVRGVYEEGGEALGAREMV